MPIYQMYLAPICTTTPDKEKDRLPILLKIVFGILSKENQYIGIPHKTDKTRISLPPRDKYGEDQLLSLLSKFLIIQLQSFTHYLRGFIQ